MARGELARAVGEAVGARAHRPPLEACARGRVDVADRALGEDGLNGNGQRLGDLIENKLDSLDMWIKKIEKSNMPYHI